MTPLARKPVFLIVALLAILGLVATACGSDDEAAATDSGPPIVIGAQDFDCVGEMFLHGRLQK